MSKIEKIRDEPQIISKRSEGPQTSETLFLRNIENIKQNSKRTSGHLEKI